MMPKIDTDAVKYAAMVISTNYIWHSDDCAADRLGIARREEVAQIVAGTAVHAYLSQLEHQMLVPRSFVESVLYSGSFEGEDLDRLHRQAEELLA